MSQTNQSQNVASALATIRVEDKAIIMGVIYGLQLVGNGIIRVPAEQNEKPTGSAI